MGSRQSDFGTLSSSTSYSGIGWSVDYVLVMPGSISYLSYSVSLQDCYKNFTPAFNKDSHF